MNYLEAHVAVQEERGRAGSFPCLVCGKPARDWAYRGGSSSELVDERGRKYSTDPEDYDPLCRSCHAKQDGWGKSLDSEAARRGQAVAWERVKDKPETRDRLVKAGALGGSKSKPKKNTRCKECGLLGSAGAITQHQKFSKHTGKEKT